MLQGNTPHTRWKWWLVNSTDCYVYKTFEFDNQKIHIWQIDRTATAHTKLCAVTLTYLVLNQSPACRAAAGADALQVQLLHSPPPLEISQESSHDSLVVWTSSSTVLCQFLLGLLGFQQKFSGICTKSRFAILVSSRPC